MRCRIEDGFLTEEEQASRHCRSFEERDIPQSALTEGNG